MEFLLIAYDGVDEEALDRRLAVREQHLNVFDENRRRGIFKYGCAILDENQKMIGSMIVCEFPSMKELEETWLSREPYVLGDVWKSIDIKPARSRVTPGMP
jgi:uncharacterized protein YciI